MSSSWYLLFTLFYFYTPKSPHAHQFLGPTLRSLSCSSSQWICLTARITPPIADPAFWLAPSTAHTAQHSRAQHSTSQHSTAAVLVRFRCLVLVFGPLICSAQSQASGYPYPYPYPSLCLPLPSCPAACWFRTQSRQGYRCLSVSATRLGVRPGHGHLGV